MLYHDHQKYNLTSGFIFLFIDLAGKEILHSDQRRVIVQAKLTYSPLRKALEKQRQPKI